MTQSDVTLPALWLAIFYTSMLMLLETGARP
jgi:hypothetical protein